jgi:glycosyltransferase EpsH
MKVSIIVPVFNTEAYVGQCIESLINQSYRNIEIIIVDDGSIDDSVSKIKSFMKDDDRIKLIQQKNSGASAARKTGIDAASGDYYMFVDSDDWIDVNSIKLLVSKFSEGDFDAIKFNGMLYPSKILKNNIINIGDKERILQRNNIVKYLFETNNLNNMCFTIYKKSVFDDVDIDFNLSNSEDYFTNLQIYQHVNKMLLIPDVLYYYRENGSSSTRTMNKKKLITNMMDFIFVFGSLTNYIDKYKINNVKTINKILFRIVDMFRINLFKLYRSKSINKKEFISIMNKFYDSNSYEYINEYGARKFLYNDNNFIKRFVNKLIIDKHIHLLWLIRYFVK